MCKISELVSSISFKVNDAFKFILSPFNIVSLDQPVSINFESNTQSLEKKVERVRQISGISESFPIKLDGYKKQGDFAINEAVLHLPNVIWLQS